MITENWAILKCPLTKGKNGIYMLGDNVQA